MSRAVHAVRRNALKRVSRLSEFAALFARLVLAVARVRRLGPLPGDLVKNPLAPEELGTTLLVFLGGALLALGLSPQPLLAAARGGPLRRTMTRAGIAFEQSDGFVRRWPSASIALLALAALFGWLLFSRPLP